MQFELTAPAMLEALRVRSVARQTAAVAAPGPGERPVPTTPTRPVAVPEASPPPATGTRTDAPTGASSASALHDRRDSFGLDSRMEMGSGGFLGLAIFPVVLFRDGMALTDVEGLGFPASVDAHRRAHPGDWTRWRHSNQEIQVLKAGSWAKLAFRRTYSTLPAGFRFDGRFARASGVRNIALGGSASVNVVSEYQFTGDGQVIRDGSVGSTASAGSGTVVTSNIAPNRRGQYTIEGVTLHIRYDDGSEEHGFLMTDLGIPRARCGSMARRTGDDSDIPERPYVGMRVRQRATRQAAGSDRRTRMHREAGVNARHIVKAPAESLETVSAHNAIARARG